MDGRRKGNMPNKAHAVVAVMVALAAGCASGDRRWNPNPELSLQKKPAEYAAYAAEQVYPADATRAEGSPVLAEVDYGYDVVNLVNVGEEDWNDVNVWVNQQFVVKLGSLPVRVQRGVNFHALYDREGLRAPSRGVWIRTVEIERDGQLYPLRIRIAD